MYYFYGNEDYLIDQEIEFIIKNNKDHTVVRSNNNNDINEIVKQISAINLFENNKKPAVKVAGFLLFIYYYVTNV